MKRHSRKTNQMECRNQNLGWEREQELKREQEFKKYKRRIIRKLASVFAFGFFVRSFVSHHHRKYTVNRRTTP